jgi:hypothetical protein
MFCVLADSLEHVVSSFFVVYENTGLVWGVFYRDKCGQSISSGVSHIDYCLMSVQPVIIIL